MHPQQLPPNAYDTYQVLAPESTHFRKATCEEIDCPNFLNGWKVRVEILPLELLHTARTSGRRFRELHVKEGETYLVFEPGQPCFQASTHRKRLEREEIFIKRHGDAHRMRGERTVMSGPTPWLDSFGENQDNLAARIERG